MIKHPLKNMVNSYDFSRYQRQVSLPGFGRAGQEALARARVLVVGVGGLGSPLALYLAGMGVGTLGLCDGDTVALSNLQRQVLFDEASCGLPKAHAAAVRLKELNSTIRIVPHAEFLSTENVRELFAHYDLIVDGSDNFATRYLINDAAVVLQKVFVWAAVQGMSGMVSVGNAALGHGDRGPTLRCVFPEPPPAELAPPCAELGVLGVVPGVVGLIQATEVVKILTGLGEALVGKMMIVDLAQADFKTVRFERNAELVAETRINDESYYRSMCMTKQSGEVAEVTAADLQARLKAGEEVCLLDVREDFERAAQSLGGIHIPMGQVLSRLSEIPRDRPVIVYCRSGARSHDVVAELQGRHGFTNLRNLAGGIIGMG